jgi:hypothetical protein
MQTKTMEFMKSGEYTVANALDSLIIENKGVNIKRSLGKGIKGIVIKVKYTNVYGKQSIYMNGTMDEVLKGLGKMRCTDIKREGPTFWSINVGDANINKISAK